MNSYEFLGSLSGQEYKDLMQEVNTVYDFNGNIVEGAEEESLETLMVVEDEFGELMYL